MIEMKAVLKGRGRHVWYDSVFGLRGEVYIYIRR